MKLTQANIKAIKQNTSNALTKKVCNYVLDEWGNYDDKKNIFTDVLHYGCQSGTVGFLIYYHDTVAFYKRYNEEINNLLSDTMASMGMYDLSDIFGDKWDKEDPLIRDCYNQNLLAWFGFEETLRNRLRIRSLTRMYLTKEIETMNRQEQKQEAIERMKMLKMCENPIREFELEDKLNQSEHGGILYWLDEKQEQYVKDFEKKHNAVVYHIIHNYTDIGEMLAFLYVSDFPEEWEYDRDDLKDGYACAYVMNLDDEWCSEFGSIGIKPQFGGVVRTA